MYANSNTSGRLLPGYGARSFFGVMAETLATAVDRSRQRAVLRELDDRLLKDIGVTHADALREAGKPFWQA